MSAAHEQVPAVDVQGDLPAGTTVLEASAGTGKTYTIAGLVTRYVAEGHVRLDQLLVVTFGRAATSELRTRVRERLLLAREALADPERARESADPVVRLLADGHESAVVARRQNLVAALSGFDAATVATTHEFCQQVLHALGTAADLDPGTVLQEDLRDLVTEVADDLYLRFYARPGAPEAHMDRAAAQSLAHAAVQDAEALLAPADAVPDSPADVRVRFARAVRQEVVVRKRALRLLGFDDLLTRVRDALLHPVTGPTARARLQERYAVVLVDEFQDTDPVQWQVLESAFHGSRTLVVIGTRSRRSTPSAGRTCGPTWLPGRRPTPSRPSTPTGAATPSCSRGWPPCCAAPPWGTPRSSSARSRPASRTRCSRPTPTRRPSGCGCCSARG